MSVRRMQMAVMRPASGRTPRSSQSEVPAARPTVSPSFNERSDALSVHVDQLNGWCDRVDSILRRAGF